MNNASTEEQLQAEIEALRARLADSEEALRAIRSGEVDALLVNSGSGERLLAFEGAESTYRVLIEEMSEGALTMTAEGLILYANRRFASMLGVPLEQVIGSAMRAWVAPEHRGALDALLKRQGREVRRAELSLASLDGQPLPVSVSVSRLRLDDTLDTLCLVATDLSEQKRNEAIVANERLARSILEQAREAIVVCDNKGLVIRASKAARSLCGKDPVGWPFSKNFALQERYGAALVLDDGVDADSHRTAEARLRRNDGQVFELLVNVGALLGDAGERLGSVVVLTDITARRRGEDELTKSKVELQVSLESVRQSRRALLSVIEDQKRVEQALRESEARYRALFADSPMTMLLIDPDGGAILDANASACAYYGWDLAALKSMRITDINDLSPQQAQVAMDRLVTGERGYFEVRHRLASGEVRDVEVFSGRIEVLGRNRLLSIVHDITERLKAQRALEESEDRFRGLVEQSIAGIFILQDGKVVYANPRCAEIGGYPSSESMIGTEAMIYPVEADRARIAEAIRRLSAGEERSISLQYSGLKQDGSVVEIGAHAARAIHEGRPAIIGMVQDISDKKRAEEQIQRYVTQLEAAFMSTVNVATTLAEMRDPYTAGHERRVADIAVALGAELGFDSRRQDGLRVAGHLHDIGKITVPAEILAKPGRLSAIEFKLIQGHPQAAYEVLKVVEFPWPVAEVALQHHERIDGSGYPQGLKGEAILFEARIMAVADVVEAMAMHRPYRPGLGIDKALAEIERGRGTLYDANVADTCLRLFREKGYTIPA